MHNMSTASGNIKEKVQRLLCNNSVVGQLEAPNHHGAGSSMLRTYLYEEYMHSQLVHT